MNIQHNLEDFAEFAIPDGCFTEQLRMLNIALTACFGFAQRVL